MTEIPQTRAKRAALLPNIEGFPSASMVRYASELETALKAAGGEDWQWQTLRMVPRAGMGGQWGSRAARFVDYPRAVRRTKADVYHVLDHSHANLIRSIPSDKAVVTCHDIIPYLAALGKVPMPAERLMRYRFLDRLRCMRRCRRIIADSHATRQDLMEWGNVSPEQVTVIYPGLNKAFTPLPPATAATRRAALRNRYGLPPNALLVMHVSSPQRYKNTPAVLHALKLLSEEPSLRGRVYLLRVSAPFFADEETLIDTLGIREQIVHAGRLPTDEDLAEHYRCADAFAFPSLWEGFGWPPLEAMACGLPPVYSNVASLPEVMGDAGLPIAPSDYQALASGLHRLLSDEPFRREQAGQCLARAARFSWDICAQEVLSVYDDIVTR